MALKSQSGAIVESINTACAAPLCLLWGCKSHLSPLLSAFQLPLASSGLAQIQDVIPRRRNLSSRFKEIQVSKFHIKFKLRELILSQILYRLNRWLMSILTLSQYQFSLLCLIVSS